MGFAANAQVSFNPGIRAGINFSHLTKGNSNSFYSFYDYDFNSYYSTSPNSTVDMKNRIDFYIGFQANIRFTRFYALQPEINYSRQGTKVEGTRTYYNNNTSPFTTTFSDELKVSYIGLQLINKFYMNQFNIHIGPTLDFVVERSSYSYLENEVDLGILLGAGYDITKNIGVEARIKKGFVPVISGSGNHSNVVIQTGVYYTFPNKERLEK